MNLIRAIIIDDEPDAIQVLSLMLEGHPQIRVLGTANSVEDGIPLVTKLQPDLIFLDVEMPERDGFELLKAFPNPGFKVIFVTAFNKYAIRAIKFAALDYLMKPISGVELGKAIQRFEENRNADDQRLLQLSAMTNEGKDSKQIVIASKKGFIVLQLDEIVSIEASAGNYAFFHMVSGKTFLCTKPLSHFEGFLPEDSFCRIHRSHIINLRYVTAFDNKSMQVTMNGNRTLAVAFRRKSNFARFIGHQGLIK